MHYLSKTDLFTGIRIHNVCISTKDSPGTQKIVNSTAFRMTCRTVTREIWMLGAVGRCTSSVKPGAYGMGFFVFCWWFVSKSNLLDQIWWSIECMHLMPKHEQFCHISWVFAFSEGVSCNQKILWICISKNAEGEKRTSSDHSKTWFMSIERVVQSDDRCP